MDFMEQCQSRLDLEHTSIRTEASLEPVTVFLPMNPLNRQISVAPLDIFHKRVPMGTQDWELLKISKHNQLRLKCLILLKNTNELIQNKFVSSCTDVVTIDVSG
jgi:hypothetical protein